ncbi:hypothetical protein FACS1894172_04710 [Spirochaetia bacterium]|nr:hypothetical protein FACS1894172_04710 [Spirochaetia bacterium]
MLEYTLEENLLSASQAGDYRAQVVNVSSYTMNEITDRIMKIGAGLTRSDVASVLEAMKQVIADILAEGSAVHFELFNAFPSIQGVFKSSDDNFDPLRHKVKINLQPGIALRASLNDVKVKKVSGALTGTVIMSITDTKSGMVNEKLTPGRDIKIAGTKLKIAGDKPENGLYFVSATGEAVKVEASDIVVNNPSEIIAVIPELAAGLYQVQLVTQYSGGGKKRKEPQTVMFNKPLTVN